jgi:Ni/Fe-hydrogenase subunit HybB-like protein
MAVHVTTRELAGIPQAVYGAIRAEILSQPFALKLWFAVLTALCLLGAAGALIALPPGWEVFGTSPAFEWGILITGYVFFAVTTSGLCLASSLGTVFNIERFLPFEKRHAVLALLSLVTAFGIIALDLHFPVRMVFGAVLSPSPFSPMWWMGVFYGAYLLFLIVEVASMFTNHYTIHRISCVCSSVTAVFAPLTLGAVFAVLAAHPFWHGALTPPYMILSAFLSGTALLGIVFWAVHRFHLTDFERAATVALPAARFLLVIAIVATMGLLGVKLAGDLQSTTPYLAETTATLVSGPLALPFWIGRVGLGLVIPLVLLALPRTRTPDGILAASALAFVGLIVDRTLFVHAGQIVPTTTASGIVSDPFAEYVPTLVELSILVGAGAFVVLMYTLAERFLDMRPHLAHQAPVEVEVTVFVPTATEGVL